jgi:serine/threonine protein kinase
MGEGCRARDEKLIREVAIKVLRADIAQDEERLMRFKREAQVLASLNHPNIAAIYGFQDSNHIVAGNWSIFRTTKDKASAVLGPCRSATKIDNVYVP